MEPNINYKAKKVAEEALMFRDRPPAASGACSGRLLEWPNTWHLEAQETVHGALNRGSFRKMMFPISLDE